MSLFDSSRFLRATSRLIVAAALTTIGMTNAFAVPSYARQTGDSCDACHIGSIGPQLTPHGMKFKLGGYTDTDGKPGHIPLAAMAIATYTHSSSDIPDDEVPSGYSSNNNTALQELSGFIAGKWFDHVGSFTQITYSGVEKVTSLDNADIRFATTANLFGGDATLGVTLNNNPTIQDPFNSLPGWRFPFLGSDFALAEAPGPLLDGGIELQALGITAYAQLANGIYAELGNYSSLSRGFLKGVNDYSDEQQKIDGASPYYRIAYFKDNKTDAYSFGLVGMNTKLKDYNDSSVNEKFNDIGVDGNYQFLGTRKHIITVAGSYIHETVKSDGGDVKLNQLKVSGSYYFDKTYGGTLGYFNVSGDSDLATNGMVLQADYTPFGKEDSYGAPWANVRVGLQYTMFNKLEGDSSGASDNNSLMAFVWASL